MHSIQNLKFFQVHFEVISIFHLCGESRLQLEFIYLPSFIFVRKFSSKAKYLEMFIKVYQGSEIQVHSLKICDSSFNVSINLNH